VNELAVRKARVCNAVVPDHFHNVLFYLAYIPKVLAVSTSDLTVASQ